MGHHRYGRVKTGCFGFCEKGPIVKVLPAESFYVEGKPGDAKEIISEQIIKGREVNRLLYKDDHKKDRLKVEDIDFYQKQYRIVLRNCGIINPENIDEYLARDGYMALEKVLFSMSPEDVINELKIAGLRGRGGAGFPAWRKWDFTRVVGSDQKYVVCNADEGDPGAYMDRSTVEGDPHSVIEAMTICGKVIGASQGYVYIRAEYPLAIERLHGSIELLTRDGLLDAPIGPSGFRFHLKVKKGAGAFVCGEETALMASIEGRRGMPRPRPPYPAVSGLYGKPTIVNNVETLGNVPLVLRDGAESFASRGTETSKGTKVFALTGKIANTGLVEVPMGISLREIIYDIGGGIPDGKDYKAVQIGGPSGGCIPKEHLDIKIDYESLKTIGAMMGSGGLVVMDSDTCMVDVAKYFLSFTTKESCGKCIPCREGTRRMYETLEKITSPYSQMGSEEQNLLRFNMVMRLEGLARVIKETSLCGLGQSAPNPVLTPLRYFREEYDAHIFDRLCPAKACRSMLTYTIDTDACKGCTLCARKCPVQAIVGEKKKAHYIVQDKCTRCGQCSETCRFDAVMVR